MQNITKYILLIFQLFIFSCTFSTVSQNIYSDPEWKEIEHPNSIRQIVVVSTNNFLENIQFHVESLTVRKKHDFPIKIGGAQVLSSYIKILRQRYPKELLLLDAGDVFQSDGTRRNKFSTIKLYNYLKYDAVALSKEMLLSLDSMAEYLGKYPVTLLNSNIQDLKTGEVLKRDNLLPYKIVKVNDINVGIMGLSSAPNKEQINFFPAIYFEDPVLAFLKTRNRMLEEGARIIVLLSQIETSCFSDNPQYSKQFKDENSYQLNCPDNSDRLLGVIKRLPPNTLDLIIGSGAGFSNGFVGSIPVVQNPGKGVYLSRIELFYDTSSNRIVPQMTTIHSPTKLCHYFLSSTKDCYLGKDLTNIEIPGIWVNNRFKDIENYQLVPAQFLGQTVGPDLGLDKFFEL